jgi:filamin
LNEIRLFIYLNKILNFLGCPKRVFIKDIDSVRINGAISENALLNTPATFQMEGINNLGDLSIRIKSPSGQEFVPKLQKIGMDECRVEWTPYELGSYTLNITYCDHLIKGAPFKVRTFDPKRVQIYNIQDGCVFKPNVFCVDASQAGEGSLEIGISCNGHYIPNQVKPLGNSKFEVHFLPQEPLVHYANINFNSEPVKGIY